MNRTSSLLLTVALAASSATSLAQIVSQIPVGDSQPAPPVLSFENNPELSVLDRYVLRIPFVDAENIPGLYQDATIEFQPHSRTWRLAGFTRATPVAGIEAVDVIVTDGIPAQVFLDITGVFTNGCQELGEVGVKRVSDMFTVYVFYRNMNIAQDPVACTADVRTFRKVVPLDVYGLPARRYSYDVNGEFSGTFVLDGENVFE